MTVYGEKHAVYGSQHCRLCNATHNPVMHLKENSESRFKLLQFDAELATIDKDDDKRVVAQRQALYKASTAVKKKHKHLDAFNGAMKKAPPMTSPVQRPPPKITVTDEAGENEQRTRAEQQSAGHGCRPPKPVFPTPGAAAPAEGS